MLKCLCLDDIIHFRYFVEIVEWLQIRKFKSNFISMNAMEELINSWFPFFRMVTHSNLGYPRSFELSGARGVSLGLNEQ